MTRIAFNIKMIEKVKSINSKLNLKAKSIPDIIEKLCDKVLELNRLVQIFSLVSKKTNLRNLFQELISLEKLLTKKEKIMFFIYRESYNKRTIFLKSIIKRLSWSKICSTQEAQNIKGDLEKQGFISIIKDCPQCGASFNFLPNECENCGHVFISQKVNFKDNRSRPSFEIKITDKGKDFVNELINTYVHTYAFFNKWNEYIGLK